MYGPGWRLYTGEVNREKVDICRAIWCRRHYSLRCTPYLDTYLLSTYLPRIYIFTCVHLRSPNAAALQGTVCGPAQHCDSGSCVAVEAVTVTTVTTVTTIEAPNKNGFGGRMSICDFFAIFGIRYRDCNPVVMDL